MVWEQPKWRSKMNFIDKYSKLSRQCFDTAVITNSKGDRVGKIIVRYTDSHIGYNNETGIMFHGAGVTLDFSNTVKGNSYDKSSVYEMLAGAGCRVYGYGGLEFTDDRGKMNNDNTQRVESISRCDEFTSFKKGNAVFRILWV